MPGLLDDEQFLITRSIPSSFAVHGDPFAKKCVRYGGIVCVAFTVLVTGTFLYVTSRDAHNAVNSRMAPIFPVRVKAQRHEPVPILCQVNVARMYDDQNPYLPSNIPGNYCSHLVLPLRGFFGSHSQSLDRPSTFLQDWNHMSDLRDKVNKGFPHLKHLISIGDEPQEQKHFIDASFANTTACVSFLVDLVKWVLDNKFSGIVLHRVFPIDRVHRRQTMLILSHFKHVMHMHGLLFIVTAPREAGLFRSSNRLRKLSMFLDYVAVITHGLASSANASDKMLLPFRHHIRRGKSVEDAIEKVLTSGLARNRVLVTISLSGHMCTLENFPLENEVPSWSEVRAVHAVSYPEVCQTVGGGNWTTDYDKESEKPHAFKNNVWIGYENEMSVRKLASLVNRMYLGGALIWDVTNDDYAGRCGPINPLVKAAFSEVEGTPLDEAGVAIIPSFNQGVTNSTKRQTVKTNDA